MENLKRFYAHNKNQLQEKGSPSAVPSFSSCKPESEKQPRPKSPIQRESELRYPSCPSYRKVSPAQTRTADQWAPARGWLSEVRGTRPKHILTGFRLGLTAIAVPLGDLPGVPTISNRWRIESNTNDGACFCAFATCLTQQSSRMQFRFAHQVMSMLPSGLSVV